jgi:hypothetical protein
MQSSASAKVILANCYKCHLAQFPSGGKDLDCQGFLTLKVKGRLGGDQFTTFARA